MNLLQSFIKSLEFANPQSLSCLCHADNERRRKFSLIVTVREKSVPANHSCTRQLEQHSEAANWTWDCGTGTLQTVRQQSRAHRSFSEDTAVTLDTEGRGEEWIVRTVDMITTNSFT